VPRCKLGGRIVDKDSRLQHESPGAELKLDESQLDGKQASDEQYDAEADEEDVAVEVT
jgi:hypothetical protein